jgi:glyoxylase-like metal-dependent hydrolase (beta-lactamase superfamily II)/8-oxo-dGTP pyrophosphatase MutT (NUDIX family)
LAEPDPIPSAAVVPLWNGRALCGLRSQRARSFPGFLAFPGGSVDDGDIDVPLASGDRDAARACALREAGEETGRWWVCAPDGEPAGDERATAFVEAVEDGVELGPALDASGLVLDDRALIALGEWVTPGFVLRRFRVQQFLLPVHEDAPVRSKAADELLDIEWKPLTALDEGWRRGDILILPPLRFVLERLLGKDPTAPDTIAALRDVPGYEDRRPREIMAGVSVQPLRTPTLPPARHTNCVMVGDRELLIIDPATPYDEERASFDKLLEDLEADGRTPLAIALTHHHHDHVGDAARLAKARSLPIWAHADTAAQLDFPVDRALVDGETLALAGDPARRLRVIHTPGHAVGHLCFFELETRTLIAGDMIASVGSILIDPPEGHMGTYLESLRRLIELDPRRAVPSHGPLLAAGRKRLEEQLAHREARQASVLEALNQAGEAEAIELVPGIYGADTPEVMFPLAARSVLAALELLVEQGSASRDGDVFKVVF